MKRYKWRDYSISFVAPADAPETKLLLAWKKRWDRKMQQFFKKVMRVK